MFPPQSEGPNIQPTSYTICKPALRGRLDFSRTPKLFLQLHKARRDARSVPVYNIQPALKLEREKWIKLGQHSLLRQLTHTGFGVDDIAVVPIENDRVQDDTQRELRRTHVMPGAICRAFAGEEGNQHTKTETELHLCDGSVWLARRQSAALYDFIRLDTPLELSRCRADFISQVQWRIDDRVKSSKSSMTRVRASRSRSAGFVFELNFMAMPGVPKVARLSSERLTMQNSYSMPPCSGQTEPRVLTEGLQSLILVSAVWVALMEGWSPVAKLDHDGNALRKFRRPSAGSSVSRRRTLLYRTFSGSRTRTSYASTTVTSKRASSNFTDEVHPGWPVHVPALGPESVQMTSTADFPCESYDERSLSIQAVNRTRHRAFLSKLRSRRLNWSFVSRHIASGTGMSQQEDPESVTGGDVANDQGATTKRLWARRAFEKLMRPFGRSNRKQLSVH